ncbi:hypothetical protein LZ30DRAFT_634946 [Colletotrichum cereale]|nr:hypothetical protein LZ30DRAFT_634946 [Colletotrichum cereale]
MSRLQLLSLVIPAFGALARESIEGDIQNASLSRDSADCYSDIVNVGQVLSISCGEWTSGLREEVLDALLEALESRLPKPDALSRFIAAYTITSVQEPEAKRFEKLSTLAKSIELQGLGGYDECASLLGHTRDRAS